MRFKHFLFLLALLVNISALAGNAPTPNYQPSIIIPRINVDIDKNTRQVHFIGTNNDPDILSKAYVLKYADPYEILPYIKTAVNSRRITSSDTKVEAIKYMDGTGIIIISAEDYRFGNTLVGMSLDEIVKVLDKPNLSVTAGRRYFLYFPKYWDSINLKKIITNVGLTKPDDPVELQGGVDQVGADVGLNSLFFYASPFSVKQIQRMLNLYDTPTPETLVKYTIYELEFENDGQIGVDFQAWKNGPGTDLFSVAARYTNGWDFINETVGNKWDQGGTTRYINFSPKWNSKYLDFLVSKSKAKVITSGSLALMNNNLGIIQCTTKIPDIEDGAKIQSNATLQQYISLKSVDWRGDGNTGTSAVGDYRLTGALDQRTGEQIVVKQSDPSKESKVNFMAARSIVDGKTYYYLQIESLDSNSVHFERSDGTNLGTACRAMNAQIQEYKLTDPANNVKQWVTLTDWSTDKQYVIDKDVTRISKTGEYGFSLILKPTICNNATTMEIEMQNTNLIGFQDDGKPRTSKTQVKTTVMFDNKVRSFVIGGLDKVSVVRSVSKVPWLGSLPIFGWLFTTESEMSKKSQIVAIIDSLPSPSNMTVPGGLRSSIKRIRNELNQHDTEVGSQVKNKYGYDQFILDSNKKSPEPAP
jgi:hypothetical protein